ncbi:hypothetical protein MB818_21330 [Ruegeria sp. 1NDH52C]|uniref:Nuclease homologue n=1 Tax=Ruegeria alba TaxID=2916756 RepID=A0ABS9P4R0_9RHOB|nr:hypothetical protein [Ruegeria alba]MCG6560755.1 hypothetical protein [Ruegeria alba]
MGRSIRYKRYYRRNAMVLAMFVSLGALVFFDVDIDDPFTSFKSVERNTVRILNGGNARTGVRPQSGSAARILTGPVTHVRDGDTIEVSGTPIRIANLDCAEKGSLAGNRATARMKELARSETLTCSLSGKRSYDRVVGTCALPDGRDIGAVLIAEGVCGRWR